MSSKITKKLTIRRLYDIFQCISKKKEVPDMRSRFMCVAVIFCLSFLAVSAYRACAEEGGASSDTDWKQEVKSDAQAVKDQRQEMKSDTQESRQEQQDLLKQIEDARQAGDFEKAKQLRDQLHATHQENAAELKADKEALKQSIQELKSDVHQARQEGVLLKRPLNPPGYNPPGVGPGNPPGYNPPGVGAPVGARDRIKDVRDRREDVRDRREDVRDKREDVRDSGIHRGAEQGVRDHGQGVGAGRGQGGTHRGLKGAGPGGGRKK